LLDGLDGGRSFRHAAWQLRIGGASQPLAAALDRFEHEEVGHGLVVGEVTMNAGLWLAREFGHHTKGTHAMGTPASDWRAFSVDVIQLSSSGSSTEAGRTR